MQRYSFGGKFLEGGVWGGGLCVFFAVFNLSLPLSFPLPQKKGVFFPSFFGVLFSFLLPNPCGKPGLSPEVPFTTKKKK